MRKRRFTDDEAIQAIRNKNNLTASMVLREIGVPTTTKGNFQLIKKIIKKYNLDTSHWLGRSYNKHKKGEESWNWKPIEYWLTDNCPSFITSSCLKKKLLDRGIKKNKCEDCGIEKWRGEDVPLELHHLNGKKRDNRLENLKVICPNCHAQTSTYCVRNIKYVKKDIVSRGKMIYAIKNSYNINQALKTVGLSASMCHYEKINKILREENILFLKEEPKLQIEDPFWRTKPHLDKRRVERPSKDELILLIQTKPMIQLAKRFGLTDNSIRKWCILYGIDWKSISPFSHKKKISQ